MTSAMVAGSAAALFFRPQRIHKHFRFQAYTIANKKASQQYFFASCEITLRISGMCSSRSAVSFNWFLARPDCVRDILFGNRRLHSDNPSKSEFRFHKSSSMHRPAGFPTLFSVKELPRQQRKNLWHRLQILRTQTVFY